jgi:hypothetical protein
MPDPEPIIDDELVLTVRIRLGGPDVTHRIAERQSAGLVGELYGAVRELLAPGDSDLTGIEIALPTFRVLRSG